METYQVLPTSALTIDPLYQRHVTAGGKRRIAKIAAAWDTALVGVLHVNHRGNGTYAVMDGQHRYLAAVAAGVTELPCLVSDSLTTYDEAGRFVKLNTLPVKPMANDIFRAKLVAGDPVAIAVANAINNEGLTISLSHKYNLTTLQSVGILQAVVGAAGQAGLERTLRIIKTAFPADTDRWHAFLIGGVAGFVFLYEQHPAFSEARFIKSLSQFSARSVLQRINTYGMASIGTGGTFGTMGKLIRPSARQALLDIYNYKLSTKKLPELSSSDIFSIVRGKNPWKGTS